MLLLKYINSILKELFDILATRYPIIKTKTAKTNNLS